MTFILLQYMYLRGNILINCPVIYASQNCLWISFILLSHAPSCVKENGRKILNSQIFNIYHLTKSSRLKIRIISTFWDSNFHHCIHHKLKCFIRYFSSNEIADLSFFTISLTFFTSRQIFPLHKRNEMDEKEHARRVRFHSTQAEWIPEIALPLKIITRRRLHFYVHNVKDPWEGSPKKNLPFFIV